MSASATPRDTPGDTARRLPPDDSRAITSPLDGDATPRAEPGLGDMSSKPDELSLPRTARSAFEVAGQFAQGGIGRILRARDPVLGRTVALKELLFAGDRGDEQRFVREVMLTARLQHPGIVPVYSAGRWPSGEPFYAMKLVSGRSFDLLIAEATTLSARLALLPHVLAIAETLAFAHAQSIIHRDLKPNNVLIGEFGETVVIDWGLAKQLDEPDTPDLPGAARPDAVPGRDSVTEQLTHVGAVVGTPGFMSPEQANSDPVDARTDVYALGVILYQTLTGQLPHDASNAAEMLFKTVFDPPVPLLQREPQAPEELVAIVDKAMAREPAHRYPTAKALADDLRRFQTGQIVGAHRYTAWELLRRIFRRYRTVLTVAAIAVVVVVLTVAVSFNRVAAERDRALRAELAALTRADKLALAQARILAETDPLTTLSLLHGLSPAADWRRIRQLAATAQDRGLPTVLQGHQAALSRALFSPDGSRLATTSDDCTLRVWNLSDRTSRAYFGHTNEVWRAAWSPDQDRIATSSRDTTVRVWDLGTGDAQVLVGHQAGVRNVAFTPDGRAIYSHSDDLVLRRWDLATSTGQDVDHCSGNNFLWDEHQVSCVTSDGVVHVHDLATGQRSDFHADTPIPSRSGAVSPDQRWLAVGTAEPAVWLWDRRTAARRLLRLDPTPSPNGSRRDLRFSPDARHLTVAFETQNLATIELNSGAVRTRRPHDGYVRRFTYSPDGTLVASVGGDSKVQLWDRLRESERALAGGPALLIDVVFSPDGSRLAAVGNDPRVFMWPTAALRRQLWSFGDRAVPLVAPEAHRALFVTSTRQVILDTARLQPIRDITTPALSASISRDGARLLTIDPAGTLTATDIDSDAVLWRSPVGPADCIHTHSLDARHLLLTCAPAPPRWIDLATGAALELPHTASAPLVGLINGRPELLIGDRQGLLNLWDPATNDLRPLHRYTNALNAAAIVPGAPQAVFASDSLLDVWDLPTASSRRIAGHTLQINNIHVSADRRRMATLSRDNRVRVFDFATGELLWSLPAPELLGSRVALSDDGDNLVASLNSGTLMLWDLSGPPGPADELELRTLRGHDSNVDFLAFEPGGLLSLGRDGRAIRWADDLPREPAALRAWIDEHHEPGSAAPVTRSGCVEPRTMF